MTDTDTDTDGIELTRKPELVAFAVRALLGGGLAAYGWLSYQSWGLVALGLLVVFSSEIVRAGQWVGGRVR